MIFLPRKTGKQTELWCLFSQLDLKLGLGQVQMQAQLNARWSYAACVWSGLCLHSRKITKPCLEVVDKVEESCGKLPAHISCMYFGFRLTFHLRMGGGNGWIFWRPASRLQIFLSALTTKFCWVAVQECTLLLGQPFVECEDLAQNPKAVNPSRKQTFSLGVHQWCGSYFIHISAELTR